MKKINLLYGIVFLFIAAACSDRDEKIIDDTESPFTSTTFTKSVKSDDVSILIFGESNNQFNYLRTLSTGWVGNIITTNLDLGKIQISVLHCSEVNTTFHPAIIDNNTEFGQIRIYANNDEDPSRTGYLLPVDEIWMPETAAMANEIHTIIGKDEIKNKLKRAVSQIEVHIKRGIPGQTEGDPMTPDPYDPGQSIMDVISGIELDIYGVGEYIDYVGSHGQGKTYFNADSETSISEEGFAFFEGPLVFPTELPQGKASVKITVHPVDSSKPDLSATVSGQLERNKKLIITLWIPTSGETIISVIDITVDTDGMDDSDEGDTGIWE